MECKAFAKYGEHGYMKRMRHQCRYTHNKKDDVGGERGGRHAGKRGAGGLREEGENRMETTRGRAR